MKDSKKGFTLIELLAVIIVLAVIALVAVPIIMNVIEDAKKGSFKDSAYGIIEAVENASMAEGISHGGEITPTEYDLTNTTLEWKGQKPKEGKAIVNKEGQVALEMNDGSTCVKKDFSDLEVTVSEVTSLNVCDGSSLSLPVEETDVACFTYTTANNKVTITGYKCKEGNTDGLPTVTDVVIPSTIEGNPVVEIGESVFQNLAITSAILPSNIETIGLGAFAGTQISAIEFPNGLKTIGNGAFNGSGLLEVVIPDSVTSLGIQVFSRTPIKKMVIGDGIAGIVEGNQFYNMQELETLVLGNGITGISNSTFSSDYVPKLTYVTLGNNLETIGNDAFLGTKIASINLPNTLTSIGNAAFGRTKLTSIVIPDSVVTLGQDPFQNCTLLTEITVGNGITSIDASAFAGAQSSLEKITLGNGIITIDSGTFASYSKLKDVTLGNSVQTIGSGAFYGTIITRIDLPNSIVSIAGGAFATDTLTTINIDKKPSEAISGSPWGATNATVNYLRAD